MADISEPVGIVYPPTNLKSIVDQSARYVAEKGTLFESMLMNKQKDNPKFSFLFPDDPINAYYRHKVNEIRNSRKSDETKESKSNETKTDACRSDEGPTDVHEGQTQDCDFDTTNDIRNGDVESDENPSLVKPELNDYIQEVTLKLEEPPSLNHLAVPASSITHTECEVIKLTAQFIATYGRPFLLEIVSREQSNSLFDFLRPQHGQFSYMTNLIMQYALSINPPLDIVDRLNDDCQNQRQIIDRTKMRAEWNRMLENERREREEAKEREKELYNQIDWHDFVIVETVDYQPGDKGEYPPTTADQVGTRLLKQQRLEDQNNPEEMEIDMDVQSEESDDEAEESNDFAAPLPPDLSKVNIRKDYDPKTAARATSQPDNFYISPLTNERVSVNEINDHLRINMSDPRYLEKKAQMLQGKIDEVDVFASGSQIQDSLKNLAERRTDIFGMSDTETAIGQRIGEEEVDQSKQEEKIIWDGHKSSLKKKKLH